MTDTLIYNKDNTTWHYIDLEDFEYQIRQQMISDEINRKRNLRKYKTVERKNKQENIKYYAMQKFIGLLLIVITVAIAMIFKRVDMSFSVITMPLGLLALFSRERCLTISRRNKHKNI